MISSRISKNNRRNPIARNLRAFRSQVVISKKRNSKKDRKDEKKIIANQGD
jgi:hypothetical protein